MFEIAGKLFRESAATTYFEYSGILLMEIFYDNLHKTKLMQI